MDFVVRCEFVIKCASSILSNSSSIQFLTNVQQKLSVDANPLFFDSLFPSLQPTTPETVISDYRQRKRADSRAEHDSTDDANSNLNVTRFGDNNVEFYAEVIGKLIGTIRDGVTTLIDDVKQRKIQRNDSASGKLKSRQLMDVMKLNSNATAANKMTNESASAAPTQKISINDTDMSLGHREVKLTTPSVHHLDDESESGKRQRESEKIQLTNESQSSIARNEVIQVIAKRTKHKRSSTSSTEQLRSHVEDLNALQSEMSIDADSPDGEMTNEMEQQKIDWTTNVDDDARWFARYRDSLARLTENHRRRKQKFIAMVSSLLSNDGKFNDESSLKNDDDDANLSFSIMRGNSTIMQVSPTQFLRMFHRGSDEHAELRMRAKSTLQRAFYKYARLYLIARKGYKDARNFNRLAKEQLKDDDEAPAMMMENFLPEALESFQEFNEINDDDDYDEALDFMTSDARRNVQAIEAFAILILEIFGAVLALSLGAIAQVQAGYFPDN